MRKQCILCLYYPHICSYINYNKMAYASTPMSSLKKINCQQKMRFELSTTKRLVWTYTRIIKTQQGVNLYQLNVLNYASLMPRPKTNTAPNGILITIPKILQFLSNKICQHKLHQADSSGKNVKNFRRGTIPLEYFLNKNRDRHWNNILLQTESKTEIT